MIPSKCGNWIHVPPKAGREFYRDLGRLGFRTGYMCAKNKGWYHVHPPKGWRQKTQEEHTAVVKDTQGRTRVYIEAARPEAGTAAQAIVIRFYATLHNYYIVDGVPVMELQIRDPAGNVLTYAFSTGTRISPIWINVSSLQHEAYRLFIGLTGKTQALDALAYWDD